MARFRTTLRSTRPPEELFAYMAEFSHAAEWDPGVVEAEMVSDRPVGPGSRFRLVTSYAGRRMALDYRITAFDPPHRVVLEADRPSFRSVDEITFATQGDETEVTYDADLRLRGVLGRLADPLLGLVFRRIGAKAAVGLEAHLSA